MTRQHTSIFRVLPLAICTLSAAGVWGSHSADAAKIDLTDVSMYSVGPRDCEVSLSFRAAYVGSKVGKEPQLRTLISDGDSASSSSMSFKQEYRKYRPNLDVTETSIVANNEKFKLGMNSRCIGTFSVKLWLVDGELSSQSIVVETVFEQ